MRNRYKLGIPLAAGLATGGYALSQGEDPGSAILAGTTGALGAGGGLLGARLAGKYMAPYAGKAIAEGGSPILGSVLSELEKGSEGGLRQKMAASLNKKLETAASNQQLLAVLGGQTQRTPFERNIQKGIAAAAVPAGALTAGLGGVALGAIPGAMGVSGFNQNVITDPELMASSNTPGARSSTPTLRYIS